MGLVYDLAGGKKGTRIQITPSIGDVFPLFYTWYNTHPLGRLVIENRESAALEQVKVEFHTPQFMDGPRTCAEYPRLGPGSRQEVPVYGLFNGSIFEVSEGTKVAGTLTVSYYYTGKQITKTIPVTVPVQNRNAMTWDDDRKAAAFITAKDPSILGFAKSTASLVRADLVTPAISPEFRIALALYQSLGLYGMGYAVDPATPFLETSGSDTAVDFLQFPTQTLSYRAGDCDDLSVLYAALLEAAGVETALVTTPGHIFVAFNSGISSANATRTFSGEEFWIDHEGSAWIPVEITMVRDGFMPSWYTGSSEWTLAKEQGLAGFWPVRAAWKEYEPVAFANAGAAIEAPRNEAVEKVYRQELARLSASQIDKRVATLKKAISTGEDSASAANKLGILYARFGLVNDARKQFDYAVRTGSLTSALINRGNLEYLSGNPKEAAVWFKKALEQDPDNRAALLGLAKTQQSSGEVAAFRETLAILETLDPALRAAHFPQAGTARAGVQTPGEDLSWNE